MAKASRAHAAASLVRLNAAAHFNRARLHFAPERQNVWRCGRFLSVQPRHAGRVKPTTWLWRPRCIGIGMSLDQTGLELGRFLSYLSQRQEVIASNIANADTPGYQTRDVEMPADFSSALFDAAGAVVEAPDLVEPQRRQQRLDRPRGPASFR